ncbi:zeta toxin family protein [Kitasatospora sp. NPDC058046]|uniref:zeta toxin family protein n=1 Tax=Kitasatospora sp. NPDC058046 TaxID=3346312 RepID=UPI0036D7EDB3
MRPLRRPPGVDFHRLSPAEHREIFDQDVVPMLLEGAVARERPVAVFVVGQPSAGKTGAALLIKRARRVPRSARTTRRGSALSQAYVRERRCDVVVETAPGSAREVLAEAEAFRRAGYRVQVLVLAVRAADSRQGTASRYAQARRDGVPARFTTAAGHDRCFGAVADVVKRATSSEVVDELVVTGRDGRALWRRGRSFGTPEWALAAERVRPYTQAEARRFLAVQAVVRRALPQHRAEVEQIAALARPLLPTRLQPSALDVPYGADRCPPYGRPERRSAPAGQLPQGRRVVGGQAGGFPGVHSVPEPVKAGHGPLSGVHQGVQLRRVGAFPHRGAQVADARAVPGHHRVDGPRRAVPLVGGPLRAGAARQAGRLGGAVLGSELSRSPPVSHAAGAAGSAPDRPARATGPPAGFPWHWSRHRPVPRPAGEGVG